MSSDHADKRRRISPVPVPLRRPGLLVLESNQLIPRVFIPSAAQRKELQDILECNDREKSLAAWIAWLHALFPGVEEFSLVDAAGAHIDIVPSMARVFVTQVIPDLARGHLVMPTKYPCLFLRMAA